MPSERESTHLEFLVLHLPGLAPLAIENKVFSVPNEEQLSRYGEGLISRRWAHWALALEGHGASSLPAGQSTRGGDGSATVSWLARSTGASHR